jgi:non-ribosomal peptide synthetase-like protein
MLGVKLGRRVEISTVAHITPDLLSIGAESFIADSACIGPTKVHLGRMTVEMTEIGSRTFVGNSALIPAGTSVGNEYLIGVMSMPPSSEALAANPATSWLGSPSVLLPRRQESATFPDSVIFNPPWYLYLIRGTIEFFRVTLPSSLFILTCAMFIYFSTMLYQATSLATVMFLFPGIYLLSALVGLGIVAVIKWAVMGRYKPCTRPLWSSFVWRTEMVTAIHECFAVPVILNTFQGTPFLAPYFRLMGSHIGKRVFMETTQITEFDLVHVGDDAALNSNCTIQTHLFEDRVMKTSDLKIGKKACVGPMSVALYDSEIHEGASLDGLSLLMKGESLPCWTQWEGIPARRNSRYSNAEARNAATEPTCSTKLD